MICLTSKYNNIFNLAKKTISENGNQEEMSVTAEEREDNLKESMTVINHTTCRRSAC
jgi:hypothetical protein